MELNLTNIGINETRKKYSHLVMLYEKAIAVKSSYESRVIFGALNSVMPEEITGVIVSPMLSLETLQSIASALKVKVYLPHCSVGEVDGKPTLIQDGLIPVGKF